MTIMAWTTPMTATANTALTSAQYNIHCRDNFVEMEPAKATGAVTATEALCLMMCSVAANNAIVERAVAGTDVQASETTTSTSYTDLDTYGPSVLVTTSSAALVWFSAEVQNDTANAQSVVSIDVSGATTTAASDEYCIEVDGVATASNPVRRTMFKHFTGLTSGDNRFTLQYKVGAGTGTFHNRAIMVWAM